ncbi:hypothetical protein [Paracoccus sp. KR1-242]|uniref:hypothetical protein n=1 Tax=Paracoccus sp. KR1-242 TaxID=3410028 RepID=UPI003C0C1F22
MKRIIGVVALALLAGACSDTSTATNEDGTPMTARMVVAPGDGGHQITMTSRKGFTCTALFDQKAYAASKQPSMELPVTCDNGDRGTAIYSNANYRQEVFTPGQTQIAYQLESGAKGSISF